MYRGNDDVLYGTPNGEIVLLDEDGHKTTKDKPHWLYFTEYKSVNWGPLGINSGDVG
jgi:hypothetical protein